MPNSTTTERPRFRLINAGELMRLYSDPEPAEEAYRRAYADGFVAAIGEMHDLMVKNGLSRHAAYEHLWGHWQSSLMKWKTGDCTRLELPPHVPAPTQRRKA